MAKGGTRGDIGLEELKSIIYEVCEGDKNWKGIETVAMEVQDNRGRISYEQLEKWWLSFADYCSKHEEVPKQTVNTMKSVPKPSIQSSTLHSARQSQPKSFRGSTTFKSENADRLSFVGHTQTKWNTQWQNLCDLVYSDNPTAFVSSFCQDTNTELNNLRESVFLRFLCPASIKDNLNDNFDDRNGCYYLENGSLFVIPKHVLFFRLFLFFRTSLLFNISMITRL